MELAKITIDPVLLTYVAQTLGRVPENLYDFQKVKNLACGGKPVYQKLIDPLRDPVPERLEIVRGDFSVIGKMSRLKKLTISAMQVINECIQSIKALMDEISHASVQQSEMIISVENRIKEVSKVIEENSDAAEESAAISNELSGQAKTLNQLISQFRIK